MARITSLIPDVELLLALEPAELAPYVLEAVKAEQQPGGWNEGNGILHGAFPGLSEASNNPHCYPAAKQEHVELAVSEAVSWLKANQLLVPAPGSNGNNGWLRLSRKAQRLTSPEQFRAFVSAASFPKKLIHPAIVEDVWGHLLRGAYQDAVFRAMRAVEEAVRAAGGYEATDYGVDMARRAFHPDNGPLRKDSDPKPEREALAALFAGAIGSYKNPHSHRTVLISDPAEAQEIVLLASHLLRIVDSRRSTKH